MKNFFCEKIRWLKYKFKKKYNYFKAKNFTNIFFIKKWVSYLIILTFLVMFVLIFFGSIGVFKFENNQLNFYLTEINLKENHYEFLWSQISSTLIVSTVVGFLGIFSTSYIYGKKQINIIFNSRGIFSLSSMFISLIVLIFISLSNCINNRNSFIILLCFIISLFLIFYMLFKVLIFYAFPRYYENNLKYEYLIREKIHIKKAMPLFPYRDREIENFKYRTMELIQINDNEYNKNIHVFMDLLNLSLLRNKKSIQEYYTEMINRTDFITSILEIVQHLIIYDKVLEADNIINDLFYDFKYYRIVPVQDHLSNDIIKSLILKGKEINNELLAKKHFHLLWSIVNNYIHLLYLYYCEIDFSYCRLGKPGKDGNNNIFYLTHNNYLQNIYQSICENMYLTSKEKERLFNDLYTNIRMMEMKEEFPDYDVRYIKEYMPINKNRISIPLIIKGEPIVLMFLKMFEEYDVKNLKLFTTMNVSSELRSYIITLTSLSLIEFISKNCVRVYANDLYITEEQIIKIYKDTSFFRYLDDSSDLYKLLINDYTEDNKRRNRYYILLPRLKLSLDVINNYYYYRHVVICNEIKQFIKITNLKSFLPDEKIIKIFKKLGI